MNPRAADLLARSGDRPATPLGERVANYRLVVEQCSDSPCASYAMLQIARAYARATEEGGDFEPQPRAAYEAFLARYPDSEFRSEASRFLAESDRRADNLADAEHKTRDRIASAPVYERFQAWLMLAEILREGGRTCEAKEAVQQTLEAIREFRNAVRENALPLAGSRRVRYEKAAAAIAMRVRQY